MEFSQGGERQNRNSRKAGITEGYCNSVYYYYGKIIRSDSLVDTTVKEYKKILRELSERIVNAQEKIRILNALKWDVSVKTDFFNKKCSELPAVDRSTYEKTPLEFDPNAKTEEFYDIERDIRRRLGQFSGIANIMLRMCREYREVVRLLQARGSPEFPKISQELYGGAQDAFYAGAPTLQDLARLVTKTLEKVTITKEPSDEKKYSSEEAVHILGDRLNKYFGSAEGHLRVKLSDDIIADASAGAEWIKLRKNVQFSERELKVLEVHEGWVHMATTLNGLAQPVCTFLSKGPPSSTISQEGLAIIMEIFTFSSSPQRLLMLTHRVTVVDMVEQGADFLDVFNFYCSLGFDKETCYHASMRVFRGCLPDRGPFTKDLSYSKGFILIYNYIRLAIKNNLAHYIPLLFLGKTTLEDLSIYSDLMAEGIIVPPKYLPEQFKDLAGLTTWMTYSLFLNQLSLERLTANYKGILQI
ncbi:MAG: flavohemoglobin expression-modulating QEGLA motif protein [Proteobacteria bacterium]|nr:flavohemoglobin expression-modulating QEGLA motif protein [Pseudomonadota bacterium]